MYGVTRTISEIKEAFARVEREFDSEKYSGLSAREFYRQFNIQILRHLGIKNLDSLQALAEHIDSQWFKVAKFYLFNDVKPVLTKLKERGLKLGLITDGYESDLEKILPRLSLQKIFDVCVCADTVGKRKPDIRVFRYALNKLNVSPSEAVFVGDRLDLDYLGAEKAGMKPVLIRREHNQLQVTGVRCISSLKEIFKILEEVEEP
jgi:putative hydrolase of the HAD superfamily